MKRAKKERPFATEVELCARFLAGVGPEWTAYAETAGWDVLLVRRADGFQVGCQAKLRFTAEVVAQAMEADSWRVCSPAPDCRAVVVPYADGNPFLATLCAGLGLTVVKVYAEGEHQRRHGWGGDRTFEPALPALGKQDWREEWHEMAPARRCELPDYVPDVPAGASAPLQLTDWKVRAIKIAVLLEEAGHVTKADFKHLGIDVRRWISPATGWLVAKDGRLLKGPHMPDFRGQHPKVYEEIKADAAKWRPPKLALLV